MEFASLGDIKKAMQQLTPEKTIELGLRLARFKKENKELLGFALFMEENIEQFVLDVNRETDVFFDNLNTSTTYYAAKSLRKMIKILNKYIRFSGSKQVEADLLIHFCKKMRNSGIRITSSTVLSNLYNRQLARIHRALEGMHEELRTDYREVYDLELV